MYFKIVLKKKKSQQLFICFDPYKVNQPFFLWELIDVHLYSSRDPQVTKFVITSNGVLTYIALIKVDQQEC